MRLTDATDPRPHVVYRLFDAQDDLLYVGVTHSLNERLRHHRSDFINPWASLVDHWTSEPFPNRLEARKAERALIAELSPRFNRHHKSPSRATPGARGT